MTKRKRKRPALKRLRRHAVDVDFDGGTLTSDGGPLLLREVDRELNLIDRIAHAIPDPRDPSHTTHSQSEILTSRIFGIAAGYEDANDQQELRHDPAFQVVAGRTPTENQDSEEHQPLASPSTHSRFENRIDSKVMFELHEIIVDTFRDSYSSPPEEIILDYDATDDTVHGNQYRRHFNGFYDSYCFLPLYVFCGDQLLVSYLRPSSVGAAHHARGITKLLVQKIRARWPETRIILRGDSGFAIERLMRWCDKNEVGYVFGLQKNDVLVREIACEMTRARIQQSHFGGKRACFKWFRYRTTKSWDRHRWVIGNPEEFYRTMYCMRGEMENRIKEPQLCLFADRTSHTKFLANQFRLLLSSFAYVLVDGLRRLGLSASEQSRWRVDTIRLRLFKIAARVRISCRRVVFHLASHCPHQVIFERVLARLCRSG